MKGRIRLNQNGTEKSSKRTLDADGESVLIVCMGNTCRSPMAEAIAHKLLGEHVRVESAGLETAAGLSATRHAIEVIREMGLELGHHRSIQFETVEFQRFGQVIAMTPRIAELLVEIGVDPARLVQLDIPDPYGRGIEVYRRTAITIEQRLRTMLCISRTENEY